MEGKVGFGFRPTDDELVGYFLRNKIEGNTGLVESINEVDICSFDPWNLRLQAKIKSRDPVWYFFSRREKKYANGNQQSRKTSSGFWKLTGDPVDVKDQWGNWCGIPEKIGEKRVLGFHRGTSASSKSKGIKSDWVIHEYHYTLLPKHERTYVVCRLEYKGDDRNMLTDTAIVPTPTFVANVTHSAGSVIDQALQGNSGSYNTFVGYDSANQGHQFNEFFTMQHSYQGNSVSYNSFSDYDSANHGRQFISGNFNMQQSVQENSGFFNHCSNFGYDLGSQGQWYGGNINLQHQVPLSAQHDDASDPWHNVCEAVYDDLLDERPYMQENYNDYRPKKPVTKAFADDSSDSDTDSMICRDAWSSTDSVGSSNGPYQTPINDLLSSSTIEPLQPKPLKLMWQSKEKVINKQKKECEFKMDEDLMKNAINTVHQKWIVLEEMSRQKNSQWIYLKNMIIGFLLFISIIVWIILVG